MSSIFKKNERYLLKLILNLGLSLPHNAGDRNNRHSKKQFKRKLPGAFIIVQRMSEPIVRDHVIMDTSLMREQHCANQDHDFIVLMNGD